MKHLTILPLILSTLSTGAFSATLEERIESAYQAQNSIGQIECKAPSLKHMKSTYVQGDSITTDMIIEDFKFTVHVDKNLKINFQSRGLNTRATINKWKELTFDFLNIDEAAKQIVTKYKLGEMNCAVVINQDKPVVLNTSNVHISVHPHTGYDPNGYTTKGINSYFSDKSFESITLLDKRRNSLNVKTFIKETGKNMDRGFFANPVVNITKDIPIIVSPAGHNMFNIKSNDLNVIYTGGNLNYCISNNTTNLVESFLQTSSGGELNIKYDLNAIVAQNKNVFSGKFSSENFGTPWFGQQLGFIPKDAFEDDNKFAKKYYSAHKKNILASVLNMTNFYKTLTFTYASDYHNHSQIIKGTGSDDYEVNLIYINK